jgi:hypothetical protein
MEQSSSSEANSFSIFFMFLMFMVPYILVIYVQLKVQLDILFTYSLFLSIS